MGDKYICSEEFRYKYLETKDKHYLIQSVEKCPFNYASWREIFRTEDEFDVEFEFMDKTFDRVLNNNDLKCVTARKSDRNLPVTNLFKNDKSEWMSKTDQNHISAE